MEFQDKLEAVKDDWEARMKLLAQQQAYMDRVVKLISQEGEQNIN